jgi:hypothetical protein
MLVEMPEGKGNLEDQEVIGKIIPKRLSKNKM